MFIGVINDLFEPVVKLAYNENFKTEKDVFYQNTGKPTLEFLNSYMKDKKFISGSNLPTLADFYLYEALCWVKGIFANEFATFANLVSFVNNFENINEIKAYLASNKYIKAPFTYAKYA